MGWGIFAGSAATSAKDTYLDLEDNERRNKLSKLAENQDSRAAAAEARAAASAAREVADREAEDAVYRDLAGQGGDATVDKSQTNMTKTSGLKAAAPITAAPAPAATNASAPTAKAAGLPTKPAARDNRSDVDKLQDVFNRTQSKAAYKMLQDAKATESLERERGSVQALRSAQTRAADQATKVSDIELGRKKFEELGLEAAASVEAYGDTPDDAPLVDSRNIQATKQVLGTLERANEALLDGRDVKVYRQDDSYVAAFTDSKSGKLIEERVFKTVGDVRQAVRIVGLTADPKAYTGVINANYNTKNFNEIAALERETTKIANEKGTLENEETRNKLQEYKMHKERLKEFNDLMKPENIVENEQRLRELAAELRQLDPKRYEGKEDETITDPADPTKSIKLSRVFDRNERAIDRALPKKEITRVDEATGETVTKSIDEVKAAGVGAYSNLLKQLGDPAAVDAKIAESMLVAGFDERLVKRAIPEIKAMVLNLEKEKTKRAVTPKSIEVPPQAQPAPIGKPPQAGLPAGAMSQPGWKTIQGMDLSRSRERGYGP